MRYVILLGLYGLYLTLNYASIWYPFIPGPGLLVLWTIIMPIIGMTCALAFALLAVEGWLYRALTVFMSLVFFAGCAGYSLHVIFSAWAAV